MSEIIDSAEVEVGTELVNIVSQYSSLIVIWVELFVCNPYRFGD